MITNHVMNIDGTGNVYSVKKEKCTRKIMCNDKWMILKCREKLHKHNSEDLPQ